MGSTKEHEALVKNLLVALAGTKQAFVWPRRAGSGWTPRGNFVKFSMDGEADITGIVSPEGWRLEVEAKTGRAVQSDDQVKFGNMIVRHGGIYLIAYDVVTTLRAFLFQVERRRQRAG